MRILFLSAYVPSPIRVRPYSFIKALAARGHAITLVCGARADDAAALDELRGHCRVVPVPTGSLEMGRNALKTLPSSMPLQAGLNMAPGLLETVAQEARSGRHDVVHIEHLRASALRAATAELPTVLDSVDCITLLFERTLRSGPSLKSRALALLDLARTSAYEAGYTSRYNQVIVTSPEDAWALRVLADRHRPSADEEPTTNDQRPTTAHPRPSALGSWFSAFSSQYSMLNAQFRGNPPAPITVIPNGVDLDYFAPQAEPREPATLVLSGKMSYHANTAAALFLGREIMPLVWARRPDVQVAIVGSAPPREVQALADDPRVSVTGFVPDLRPYLARASLAVAPLRYGVGIQNKVLEAMAMGAPVVAARQVARALQAEDGAELRFAERPAQYAEVILALLDSPAERERMGQAARRYVEQRHDWRQIAAGLEQVYSAAIGSRPS
jgi:glycosyltransferase involved in cell wall biosynthesis